MLPLSLALLCVSQDEGSKGGRHVVGGFVDEGAKSEQMIGRWVVVDGWENLLRWCTSQKLNKRRVALFVLGR